MGQVFKIRRLVRHGHTDPAGFAFYPRYFEMINETIEDFFRQALNRPFGEMHLKHRFGVPTVHMETTFHAPSYCDEELSFELTVMKMGRASATFEIMATCNGEKRLTTQHTIVYVQLDDMKSVPFDDALRDGMANYLLGDERKAPV